MLIGLHHCALVLLIGLCHCALVWVSACVADALHHCALVMLRACGADWIVSLCSCVAAHLWC